MSHASDEWIEAMSQARLDALDEAAVIADGCGGTWGNDLADAFNDGCHFAANAIRTAKNTQHKEG